MNVLNLCDSGDILSVFRIVNIVITVIKIVVPIILILSLMIDYAKAVYNKDSDALAKVNRLAAKKVIAAILIFYIPTFVNIIAKVSSYNDNSYLSCLSNATIDKIQDAYIKQTQQYVDIAKKEALIASYTMALEEVRKLKDSSDKTRMLSELEEVKKEIERKEQEKYEEWLSHQKSEKGWWFPVGSSSTTTRNGVLFAPDAPVTTRLTAYFGGNDKVHKGLGGGHGAIDVGATQGSYVIATRSGTVVKPGAGDRIDYPNSYIKPDENGKYNCAGLKANYVKIDHGDGTMSGYAHLLANTITVKAGDKVEQGQVIGKVGSSGCSTGPHLHFEVYVDGTRVDPLDYVSTTETRP